MKSNTSCRSTWGNRKDVVPVYGNSLYFQGFFAEGAQAFIEKRHTHYIFVADDLLLNPVLGERSILDILGIGAATLFITNLRPPHQMWRGYPHIRKVLSWTKHTTGVEYRTLLPSNEEAKARFATHGLTADRVPGSVLNQPVGWYGASPGSLWLAAKRLMLNAFYSTKSWELPYPLLYGYADFLIVDASAIEEFCYLCGVFAAMNVFVEFAAATALVLAAKAVKTDDSSTSGFRGYMTWDSASLDQIYARYEGDLTRLMAGFPPKQTFIHPIKLSKWRIE